MTDTPNRLPLSPAAQAVLDSYGHEVGGSAAITGYERRGIAAALRAAADQVVPYDPKEAMHFTTEAIRLNRMSVRASFLAIAAELEGRQ